MRWPRELMLVGAVALLAASAHAQVTVESVQTGDMEVLLSAGIYLNKGSTLRRQWIIVRNASMPADLPTPVGVRAVFEPNRLSGSYRYEAEYTLDIREPVSAVEVRFLVFDVWGDFMKILIANEITDFPPGATRLLKGIWALPSEADAARVNTSIGYVARVRTKAGRIIEADRAAVLAEARKISRRLSESDIEPKPDPGSLPHLGPK